MPNESLTIGDLAAKVGVRVDTIRYYEKLGLLPKPKRSSGNHRVYDAAQLEQLTFIVRAREQEFSLKDIAILLGGFRGDAPRCCDVKALTEAHLARLRAKIAKLRGLERELAALTAQCRDDSSSDCIIVQSLCGCAANAKD